MSASKGEKHSIDVFADPARIRKQIRSAVTDAGETKEGEMSAGVANLFSLLKAAGDSDNYGNLTDDYNAGSLKYVDLKDAVANAVIRVTDPFRAKRSEVIADKKRYKERVKEASVAIRERAKETLKEVKDLVGLLNVK